MRRTARLSALFQSNLDGEAVLAKLQKFEQRRLVLASGRLGREVIETALSQRPIRPHEGREVRESAFFWAASCQG